MSNLRILVSLVVTLAGFIASQASVQGKRVPVAPFAPGDQSSVTLNAGLPESEYGYHPDNSNSWGECWFVVAQDQAGGQVWVLFSVSNYHPFKDYSGTVDIFYYPAGGERHSGHVEVDKDKVKGKLDSLAIEIGNNSIAGTYPEFSIKAQCEKLGLDLRLTAETPSFLLGQQPLYFGSDRANYWTAPIIAPRAEVTGTIMVDSRRIPFQGKGYFDHGRSTIKVPEFSENWHVVRVLSEGFSLGAMQIVMKAEYDPAQTTVLHVTVADKVVINSGAATLTGSNVVEDAASKVRYPTEYLVSYKQGATSLQGKIKFTQKLEAFNVLDRLSFLVRKVVKAFYTNPWQFRFNGEADLTLTYEGGTKQISGLAIGEFHSY